MSSFRGWWENNSILKKVPFTEYFKALGITILIAVFLKVFVIQTYNIPTESMRETLDVGDYLVVNKFIYGIKTPFMKNGFFAFRQPQKSDVVVFKYPVDRSKHFIKRLIGMPGDIVEGKDKNIYVNGVLQNENYIIHKEGNLNPTTHPQRDTFGPVRVPANSYFMMGDNRDQSQDSRFWGVVPKEDVIGLALFKYWSFDRYLPRWKNIGTWIK